MVVSKCDCENFADGLFVALIYVLIILSTVQVSLYCMTRLLAETHPALYRHLDTLEADPSL